MCILKYRSRFSSVISMSYPILLLASVSSALNVSSNMTLTRDYNEAINITADNVTLDLNGYTVDGVNGYGITINGRTNVTVQNGNVTNCTAAGINIVNSSNVRISNISSCYHGGEGFRLRYSDYVSIDYSLALSNYDGYDQNSGTSSTYYFSNAYFNVHNGFEVDNGNGFGYIVCKSFWNGCGLTDGGRHGISISDQSTDGFALCCNASWNGGNGFHLNSYANSCSFSIDTAQGNINNGFSLNDHNTNIMGFALFSIDNAQDGISFDKSSSHNIFSNSDFNNNRRDGVHIRDGSTDNEFVGCRMLSNVDDNVDDNVGNNRYINCTY